MKQWKAIDQSQTQKCWWNEMESRKFKKDNPFPYSDKCLVFNGFLSLTEILKYLHYQTKVRLIFSLLIFFLNCYSQTDLFLVKILFCQANILSKWKIDFIQSSEIDPDIHKCMVGGAQGRNRCFLWLVCINQSRFVWNWPLKYIMYRWKT